MLGQAAKCKAAGPAREPRVSKPTLREPSFGPAMRSWMRAPGSSPSEPKSGPQNSMRTPLQVRGFRPMPSTATN